MSGFEVEFRTVTPRDEGKYLDDSTRYPGWAPIRHMFGTPKLVKNFHTIERICTSEWSEELTSLFWFNLFDVVDDACFAGIFARCGAIEELTVNDSFWNNTK